MTLTLPSLKIVIYAVIVVMVAVFTLGAASSLAIQEAQAQAVVVDPTLNASNWAIRALNTVWDAAQWVAKKAWDGIKFLAQEAWKWVKKNIADILIGAAIRVASDLIAKLLSKLKDDRKIQSYLYYADFLVRSVYALEYIQNTYGSAAYNRHFEKSRLTLYIDSNNNSNSRSRSVPYNDINNKSVSLDMFSLPPGRYTSQAVLTLNNGHCIGSNVVRFTVQNGGADSDFPAPADHCHAPFHVGSVSLQNPVGNGGDRKFTANVTTGRDNRNAQVVLALVNSGEELYGKLNPGSTFYQYVKNQTVLNPKCQTHNLNPQDPNYYERLLESQGADCIPQYSMAVARDAAFSALGQAQQAAQQEIEQGAGFQSLRECGTVVSEDIYKTEYVPQTGELKIEQPDGSSETANPPPGSLENPDLPTSVTGTTGYTPVEVPVKNEDGSQRKKVDLVGSGFSLLCSAITLPAAQTSIMIQELTEQLLKKNFDTVGNDQNSNALKNFFTTVVATAANKYILGEGINCGAVQFVGSAIGISRSCSEKVNPDISQIPEGLDTRPENFEGGNADLVPGSTRDSRDLRNFWNELCSERLPLLYSFERNEWPKRFGELSISALQSGSLALNTDEDEYPFFGNHPNLDSDADWKDWLEDKPNGNDVDYHDGYNKVKKLLQRAFNFSDFSSLKTTSEYETELKNMTVYDMLNTPMPFVNRHYTGSAYLAYEYVWQVLDPVDQVEPTGENELKYRLGSLSTDGVKKFSQGNSAGRRYALSKEGLPSAEDIKSTSEWLPQLWPFFKDAKLGKGYDFTYPGEQDFYAEERMDSQGTAKLIVPEGSENLQNLRIYSIGGNLLAMHGDQGSEKMWRLDKSLTVTIDRDGNPTYSTNDLRLGRSDQIVVIEYTDENNQVRVYSAYELEQQRPCEAEPFGPPADVQNFEAKIKYSKNIAPALWEWLVKLDFANRNSERGF